MHRRRSIDQLTAHDDAEQQARCTPSSPRACDDAALLDRSLARPLGGQAQIDHLKAQEGPPFVEAVRGPARLVEDHVADEEKNLLPALRKAATDQQLDELGGRILQAKQRGG